MFPLWAPLSRADRESPANRPLSRVPDLRNWDGANASAGGDAIGTTIDIGPENSLRKND